MRPGAGSWLRGLGLGVLLAAAVTGCTGREAPVGAGGHAWVEPPSRARSWVPVEWEEVWSVGTERDPLLGLPLWLTPGANGVHLYDDQGRAVLSFGMDGELRWSFGQAGRGPGEVGGLRSVAEGVGGAVHLLDVRNRKVIRLDPAGQLEAELPFAEGNWQGLLPLASGEYLVDSGEGAGTLRIVDPALESVRTLPIPWPGFERLSSIERQGRLLGQPGGGRGFVFALMAGDGWFAFEDGAPLDGGRRFVEEVPAPEVAGTPAGGGDQPRLVGRPVMAAVSGWIQADTVHIHFGGRSDRRFAVIDRYDFSTGAYLNSLALPGPVNEATRVGDLYIFLTHNPWPRLRAYRIRDAAAGAQSPTPLR